MGVLDTIVGSMLLATLLNCGLFGISLAQAFQFYRSFGLSNHVLFSLVTALLALSVIQTSLCISTAYFWCVTGFGDAGNLQLAPITYALDPVLSGLIATLAQAYYTHRLYLVSGRSKFVFIIAGLSLAQLGWSFANTIGIFQRKRLFYRLPEFNYGVDSWLILMSITDLIISGALIFYLKKLRTEYVNTSNLVASLIRNTLETNSITTAVAMLGLALFLEQSYTGLSFVIPQLILSKFYFISLLSSLNSRKSLTVNVNNATSSNQQFNPAKSTAKMHTHYGAQSVVNVVTEERVEVDIMRDSELMDRQVKRNPRFAAAHVITSDQHLPADTDTEDRVHAPVLVRFEHTSV